MRYKNDELLIDDEIVDTYQNEWVKNSYQVVDSIKYNVYQGIGDSSLIKLMIRDEIDLELL